MTENLAQHLQPIDVQLLRGHRDQTRAVADGEVGHRAHQGPARQHLGKPLQGPSRHDRHDDSPPAKPGRQIGERGRPIRRFHRNTNEVGGGGLGKSAPGELIALLGRFDGGRDSVVHDDAHTGTAEPHAERGSHRAGAHYAGGGRPRCALGRSHRGLSIG